MAINSSRRNLLAGTTAALLAGVPVAGAAVPGGFVPPAVRIAEAGRLARGAGPDAELLDACAAFQALHAEEQAWDRGQRPDLDADEDAAYRLGERWAEALERVTALPATTTEGLHQKVAAALAAFPGGFDLSGPTTREAAALAALRDAAWGAWA